jgi:hypothetical protein
VAPAPRKVCSGVAGLADRRLRRRAPTRNSMMVSADPGRRREHDNPRDECGHAGIQQDFVENSNHSTLSHTRLPLRAAALGHSQAHWTAKCYEFDNKEVRNGTKNGSPRVAGGSPNNAALIIERGHRPLLKADIASLPRACLPKLKICTATNAVFCSITRSVRASRRSGKVMPVSRASMRAFRP